MTLKNDCKVHGYNSNKNLHTHTHTQSLLRSRTTLGTPSGDDIRVRVWGAVMGWLGEKTRENVESDIKRWRNKMIYPAAAATLPFTRPVTVLLIVLVATAHSRGRFGPSNRTRSAKLLFNFIYTLALFLYSSWRVSLRSSVSFSSSLSLTHTLSWVWLTQRLWCRRDCFFERCVGCFQGTGRRFYCKMRASVRVWLLCLGWCWGFFSVACLSTSKGYIRGWDFGQLIIVLWGSLPSTLRGIGF